MTMSDLKELLSELDFEQWLDMEGIIYRRGGVSARGREVNIKECPVCGSTNWKVYFNLTNNVGKCFAGTRKNMLNAIVPKHAATA